MSWRLIYLGALFTVVPFVFFLPWGVDPIRTSKDIAVACFAALPLCYLLWNNIRPSLALFAGYLVLNCAVTGFGPGQLNDLSIVLLALCSVLPLIDLREKHVRLLTVAISVSGVVMAVLGIMQMFKYDPLFRYYMESDKGTPIGTLGQQTVLGPYLAVCIACSLFTKRYKSLAIIMIPAIATWSSFSWASIAVVFYVWSWTFLSRGLVMKLTAAGLVSAIAIVVLGLMRHDRPEFLMDNYRFQTWGEIWFMYTRFDVFNLVVGKGFGSFKYIFFNTMASKSWQSEQSFRAVGPYIQAHNDYLQVIVELGTIGFTLLLFMICDVCSLIRSRFHNKMIQCWGAIILLLAVNSVGNFPMHVEPHGILMLAAIIIVATLKEEPL